LLETNNFKWYIGCTERKYSVGAGKNIIFVAGNGVFLHNNVKTVIPSNSGKYFYTGNSVKSRYISLSNKGTFSGK
jgi:hypothetical protein